MKKIIISVSVFLFCLFFLKQNIYATCAITAPDSTDPNKKINIVTTGIPDCNTGGSGYCPAFVVYDSNNKEIGCHFVPNSTNNRDITTPSDGTSIKIQIESRALDTNAAITDQSCLNKLSQSVYCSKTISLAGETISDETKPPSCSASLTQGNTDYINIKFNNASGLGYVFYVVDSDGTNHGSGSITNNSTSIMVGEGWPAGTYKIEVRESETQSGKGKLLTSCSFYYNGISALERLNKAALGYTEPPNLQEQINKIVNYSTGIGGVIAFLLIVFGGFQIILSAGNPERVKAGKEMITSAIAGLLLIIFAVFILKLIGYDILKIPGFKP